MSKLINTENLGRLSKALDERCKELINEEKERMLKIEVELRAQIAELEAALNPEVKSISVTDGQLILTTDKYQKVSNLVDGTAIVFPPVTKFTELHLYFSTPDNLNLNFPDCKWRVEPNIEAGSSYEMIAIYNTIEWIVNIVVYS